MLRLRLRLQRRCVSSEAEFKRLLIDVELAGAAAAAAAKAEPRRINELTRKSRRRVAGWRHELFGSGGRHLMSVWPQNEVGRRAR